MDIYIYWTFFQYIQYISMEQLAKYVKYAQFVYTKSIHNLLDFKWNQMRPYVLDQVFPVTWSLWSLETAERVLHWMYSHVLSTTIQALNTRKNSIIDAFDGHVQLTAKGIRESTLETPTINTYKHNLHSCQLCSIMIAPRTSASPYCQGPQGPNMRAEGQSIWRSEFNAKVKQDATINFDENTLKIERIYVISCGWFRWSNLTWS